MKTAKSTGATNRKVAMSPLSSFMLEALETELGGVDVYKAALECARNADLREEWQKYLEETKNHVTVLTDICTRSGVDPKQDTPGRQVVRLIGKSLVKAMNTALGSVSPEAAEIVAAECVVHAETKDHMNWTLLKEAAGKGTVHGLDSLRAACDKYEDEEDEHLYHTQGWARELTRAALGLDATLPPQEEVQGVNTAIGTARARNSGNSAKSERTARSRLSVRAGNSNYSTEV